MAIQIGATVSGKVIRISAEGTFVSLPEGKTGLIPAPHEGAVFSVGETIVARVVTTGEGEGVVELAFVSARVAGTADPFEKEFNRLNHVLQSCAPRSISPPSSQEPLLEERLKAWVKEAEAGLSRLRKHRGKRLSETIEGHEGRRNAKRDRNHR